MTSNFFALDRKTASRRTCTWPSSAHLLVSEGDGLLLEIKPDDWRAEVESDGSRVQPFRLLNQVACDLVAEHPEQRRVGRRHGHTAGGVDLALLGDHEPICVQVRV